MTANPRKKVLLGKETPHILGSVYNGNRSSHFVLTIPEVIYLSMSVFVITLLYFLKTKYVLFNFFTSSKT